MKWTAEECSTDSNNPEAITLEVSSTSTEHEALESIKSYTLQLLNKDAITCVSMSCVRRDTNYIVYRLDLSDDSAVIANIYSSDYPKEAVEAEVACLTFIKENTSHFSGVIVPKVLAHNSSFDNPLNSPVLLLELIEGRIISDLEQDVAELSDRLKVVSAAAQIQASLLKPLPSTISGKGIGVLRLEKQETEKQETESASEKATSGDLYIVSAFPCTRSDFIDEIEKDGKPYNEANRGPFSSLKDYWVSLLEERTFISLYRWENLPSDILPLDYDFLADSKATPQDFGDLLQFLGALIGRLANLPPDYGSLVFVRPRPSLAHLVFDKDDITKVIGVYGWDGAFIGPAVLAARHPREIFTSCRDLETKKPTEHWDTVPWDWTSLPEWNTRDVVEKEGTTQTEGSTEPKPKSAETFLQRFYYRQYYVSCISFALGPLMSTFFEDSVIYLKMDEVLRSLRKWFEHDHWIRETYWRLRLQDEKGVKRFEQQLTGITLPQVYKVIKQRQVLNIGVDDEGPLNRLNRDRNRILQADFEAQNAH